MSVPKDDLQMEVEAASSETVKDSTMEVSTDSDKNVMASGTTGSITCSLHPLVIMNVSEHWTREKAQEGSVQQGQNLWMSRCHRPNPNTLFLVIGALIGKQKGRNIEIMNSFELVFSIIGGDVVIDRDYYNMKEEQCKITLDRTELGLNISFPSSQEK